MKKINKEFNVSGKIAEKQKERLADDARLAKINQLRDADQRNQAEILLMRRDEKVKIQKEKDRLQEEKIVQQHLRAKSAAKVELNLTIKNAQAKKDPKQIEKAIRHNIKITHGAEMENARGVLRKDLNKDIDKTIEQNLKKQNSQEHKTEFNKEAKKTRPWDRDNQKSAKLRPWEENHERGDDGRNRDR